MNVSRTSILDQLGGAWHFVRAWPVFPVFVVRWFLRVERVTGLMDDSLQACHSCPIDAVADSPDSGRGPAVLLGETRALDPETGSICPARIVERDGEVFLEKTLSSGKTRNTLVERDAGFYRRFAHADLAGKHRILNHFFYVTSRCNLKCPVCYEGKREVEEPSLEMLCAQLPKISGARVALCGAEPTCREDLPDLIRAVNKRHVALLMTNGLKLADMKYLHSLREAGLTYVIFSMNGMNDDVFRRTNGQALLDIKLKALGNLEQLGMSVLLSATITRGANEDQIRPLLELEKRRKCILQVRFRSMTEMGCYVEGGQFCTSEFVKLICQQGGIDYDLWLKQQDFYDHLGRTIGIDHIRPRLCAMRADLDKDLVPFAAERDWRAWDEALIKKPRLVAKMLNTYGLHYAYHYVRGLLDRYSYTPHPNFRRIAVRVWPTLDTMDLNLNRRCSSVYHRDGEVHPFCLSNALRSK